MKNDIDLEGLVSWLNETDVTYASSTRERKRLTVNLKGVLIITVAGKVVWQGMQPFTAVEEYNKITQKYQDEKFELKF